MLKWEREEELERGVECERFDDYLNRDEVGARVEGIDVLCLRITNGDGDVVSKGGEMVTHLSAERACSWSLRKTSDHMGDLHLKNLLLQNDRGSPTVQYTRTPITNTTNAIPISDQYLGTPYDNNHSIFCCIHASTGQFACNK